MTAPPDVTDNREASRFELRAGDGLGVLDYTREGDRLYLTHTEVPPAVEGRGLGSALARAALEQARVQGLHVVPWCPFVRAYIDRYPEYTALVVPG